MNRFHPLMGEWLTQSGMEGVDGCHFVDKLLQLPCSGIFSVNSKDEITLYPPKRCKRLLIVHFLPILQCIFSHSLYFREIDVNFHNQETEMYNIVKKIAFITNFTIMQFLMGFLGFFLFAY